MHLREEENSEGQCGPATPVSSICLIPAESVDCVTLQTAVARGEVPLASQRSQEFETPNDHGVPISIEITYFTAIV
jgi:hypothetical protein